MSALNQLRPFVSFCQACGLIPFTMVYDPINKKFLRFAFSWKSRTTWWFIFMLVSQVLLPLVTIRLGEEMIGKVKEDKQAPVTLNIFMSVTILCYLEQFILSRWLLLRHHRRLQSAVKWALKVETVLQTTGTSWSTQNSAVYQRFALGFSLIILTV